MAGWCIASRPRPIKIRTCIYMYFNWLEARWCMTFSKYSSIYMTAFNGSVLSCRCDLSDSEEIAQRSKHLPFNAIYTFVNEDPYPLYWSYFYLFIFYWDDLYLIYFASSPGCWAKVREGMRMWRVCGWLLVRVWSVEGVWGWLLNKGVWVCMLLVRVDRLNLRERKQLERQRNKTIEHQESLQKAT